MSDFSDAIASGLSALSTFKGEVLTYATTKAGTYAALTGFFLQMDRIDPVRSFDDARQEEQWEWATLKGPLSPALVAGYYVKDGLNSSRLWYIEAVKTDIQQVCRLRRINQGVSTPNRGGSR